MYATVKKLAILICIIVYRASDLLINQDASELLNNDTDYVHLSKWLQPDYQYFILSLQIIFKILVTEALRKLGSCIYNYL